MRDKTSTIMNVLQQQFDNLEGQMNGATNSQPHLARKTAFNVFKELGLPGRKDEEYRYTPLAKQLESDFAGYVNNPEISEPSFDLEQLPEFDGSVIVFVNGKFEEALSNIITQEGAKIQVDANQKELINNSFPSTNEDIFNSLNLALTKAGVQIDVDDNTVIEHTISIVNISDSKQGKVISTPRHEVNIGHNAQATISEIFIGCGEQSSFTNSVMVINIAASAILNHYKMGLDEDSELRIDNTTCVQKSHSTFNSVNINFGGKIVRNNLKIIVGGEHCETNLNGLYMPSAGGNIDNHTVVDHAQPNSTSNELYKGIMGDNATGVFNGKVFVRQNAQKTNAFQSNKNILLADSATINTKPQLEIWADDVKCSHGCTTGQLDKEQLFYLRARGIDKANAQKLLLKAFAEEILEKLKDDKLRARVAAVLEEKLEK